MKTLFKIIFWLFVFTAVGFFFALDYGLQASKKNTDKGDAITNSAPPASTAPAAPKSDWNYFTSTDQMTDSAIHYAKSIHGKDSWGVQKLAAWVRCEEKAQKLDVFFDFGEYLDNSTVRAHYRFDKLPAQYMEFNPSTKGTSIFAITNDARKTLLNGMKVHNTLTIQASDYNGTKHLIKISLRGSTAAISKVLPHCGK